MVTVSNKMATISMFGSLVTFLSLVIASILQSLLSVAGDTGWTGLVQRVA
jgi:hypothetical protein